MILKQETYQCADCNRGYTLPFFYHAQNGNDVAVTNPQAWGWCRSRVERFDKAFAEVDKEN